MKSIETAVPMDIAEIEAATHDSVLPDPERLLHALRSIGYSIEHAIADIIDNSIDANAKNVLVRIIHDDSVIKHVVIADDGDGMSATQLQEAMRLGARTEHTSSSLSKYGLGLKLASFSQAQTLGVFSRQKGIATGRRWTPEGIKNNWHCDVLPPPELKAWFDQNWGEVDLSKSGTLVIWSQLDRTAPSAKGVEVTINRILKGLRSQLGMHLHRIISAGRIQIRIDLQHEGEAAGPASVVDALDPFGHPTSGDERYPKRLGLELPGVGKLELNAHVWTPNSKDPNYTLDGKVAQRQGFFFYRNDRLIQAGGWNGYRDLEPHHSLARIAVDLPSEMDSAFSLDVKKSSIQVPPSWTDALKSATASDGSTFPEYVSIAKKAYSKHEREDPDNHPLVPGEGLSRVLRDKLREILVPQRSRVRSVTFKWDHLDGNVFDIDREEMTIILNKHYRKRLLGGANGSSADAPMLKVLLFLLLEEDLTSARISRAQAERLAQVQKVVLEAMRELPEV